MPKTPAVTIEVYNGARGDFRYRFIGRNGQNMQHSYNRKVSCQRTLSRLISSIKTGDFEFVDKTKRKRADDQCGE